MPASRTKASRSNVCYNSPDLARDVRPHRRQRVPPIQSLFNECPYQQAVADEVDVRLRRVPHPHQAGGVRRHHSRQDRGADTRPSHPAPGHAPTAIAVTARPRSARCAPRSPASRPRHDHTATRPRIAYRGQTRHTDRLAPHQARRLGWAARTKIGDDGQANTASLR